MPTFIGPDGKAYEASQVVIDALAGMGQEPKPEPGWARPLKFVIGCAVLAVVLFLIFATLTSHHATKWTSAQDAQWRTLVAHDAPQLNVNEQNCMVLSLEHHNTYAWLTKPSPDRSTRDVAALAVAASDCGLKVQ